MTTEKRQLEDGLDDALEEAWAASTQCKTSLLTSIAISLKRIADSLDSIKAQPGLICQRFDASAGVSVPSVFSPAVETISRTFVPMAPVDPLVSQYGVAGPGQYAVGSSGNAETFKGRVYGAVVDNADSVTVSALDSGSVSNASW